MIILFNYNNQVVQQIAPKNFELVVPESCANAMVWLLGSQWLGLSEDSRTTDFRLGLLVLVLTRKVSSEPILGPCVHSLILSHYFLFFYQFTNSAVGSVFSKFSKNY